MKAFILKDLLLIKGNIKMFLTIAIVFCVMTYLGYDQMLYVLPVISLMLSFSTFSYDEYNKWDAYAISTPGGRSKAVLAKYVMAIMLGLFGTLVTVVISIIISILKPELSLTTMIYSSLGACVASFVFPIFMYPIIYKFGIEKGRIGIFVIVFSIVGLGSLGYQFISKLNIDFSGISNMLSHSWFIVVPLVFLVALYISYRISNRLYLKKEF